MTVTPAEFVQSWLRARERIYDRHRKLSFRQQRRKRSKRGQRTDRVVLDYRAASLTNRIRIEEVFPVAWRDKLRDVVRLAADGVVEIWIGAESLPVTTRPKLDRDQQAKLFNGKLQATAIDWTKARAGYADL